MQQSTFAVEVEMAANCYHSVPNASGTFTPHRATTRCRMGHHNLASFVRALEDDGDLVRVAAKVDPQFEIAEITRRMCSTGDGGPALFFEDVKGSTASVV